MKKINLSAIIPLLGCLLLGGFLRFQHIGLRPFWLDEANSVNFLQFSWGSLWQQIAGAESAPAYIYAIKAWSLILGDSEATIRSFSAMLSLFSILVIYFLGKKLFNEKVGLWSAFLLAINYFSFFYTLQARQYSAVILISLLAYFYFLQILSRKKISDGFWFILFSTLGLYLHPWFAFVFLAEIIWVIFRRKEKTLLMLGLFSGIALFFLPWLKILFQYRAAGVNDWISSPGVAVLLQTFQFFIYGSGWIYLIILSLATPSLFFVIKKEKVGANLSLRVTDREDYFRSQSNNFFMLAWFLFFPLLAAWILSQWFPFYVVGRYEALVLPFFVILLAFLYSQLRNKFLILGVLIIFSVFAYKAVKEDEKTILSYKYNDKNIAQLLSENIQTEDRIIFTDLSRPPFDYYLPRLVNENKTYAEYSFPLEMEGHPAFQSERIQLRNRAGLEQEAENLVDKIENNAEKYTWIILAENPVSKILWEKINKLNCNIFLDLTLKENQPVSPLHFQQIWKCGSKNNN